MADPGLLLNDKLLFASFDAVLYALRRNGNLAWRAALPARPLSAPLLAGEYLVIACLEDQIVVIAPETGLKVGSLRTGAEIRTPPLVLDDLLVVGLRDRSVVAYPRPGASPTPAPAPAPRQTPG